MKNPSKYPKSKFSEKIILNKSGYVKSIDNYEIGMAALELGAGRMKTEDKIEPKAGVIFNVKIGDRITKNSVVAELFTDDKTKIDGAKRRIENAIKLSKDKINKVKLIKAQIS